MWHKPQPQTSQSAALTLGVVSEVNRGSSLCYGYEPRERRAMLLQDVMCMFVVFRGARKNVGVCDCAKFQEPIVLILFRSAGL